MDNAEEVRKCVQSKNKKTVYHLFPLLAPGIHLIRENNTY